MSKKRKALRLIAQMSIVESELKDLEEHIRISYGFLDPLYRQVLWALNDLRSSLTGLVVYVRVKL